MSPVAAALGSFIVLAAVFWPLERLFPARKNQPWLTRFASVDTLFFFGQYLVWTSLAIAALAFAQPHLQHVLPASVRDGFASQPAALQVLEAVFLADLCVYWFHRACHRFELLWRFHAVHHSAPQVDWLAAHREHPLDGLFTHAVINLPLLLLGVPLSWLAGLVAFRGLWAIFVHSNVKLPLGPLRYLFGAPELHRWHHAREGMGRHNFANLAPYMDLLFGTYHRPTGEEEWEVGLEGPFPRGYVGQLTHPFGKLQPALVASLLLVLACGGMTVMMPPDAGPQRPKLSNVPDCGTPGDAGTAVDLYDAVIIPNGCATDGCHGLTVSMHYAVHDAASLRTAWVSVKSKEVPDLNRVTPGDIDESYVVYKLMGQQVAAGGGGDQMPQAGVPLTDPDLCRVIDWIRAGAR